MEYVLLDIRWNVTLRDVKVDESMGDMQKILECVFEKINATEKRLSYGVGSKYVEDIMQVLCEKYK